MKQIKKFFEEVKLLERSIPGFVTALFVISVVVMNLLANKSIDTKLDWLALDCGIIFSWAIFLVMDIITKRFGPRAATILSVVAMLFNLFIALMLFIAGLIPGFWGESFVDVGGDIINIALDNTISGTWYVLLGSSIAFLVSAIVNNVINYLIGKAFNNKSSFVVFALRSYVSTFIGQFIDNLTFAFIVSHVFFGWTTLQCFTCAFTGAIVELLFEVIFSPIGYKIVKKWEKEDVGKDYLNYIEQA